MMLTENEVNSFSEGQVNFGNRIPNSEDVSVPDVDSLLGEEVEIAGKRYFKTIDGDTLNAGFLVINGMRRYLTIHIPTGSEIKYRKVFVNGLPYWEEGSEMEAI